MKQALRVGALYFAAVFAVGFGLGVVRTVWLVPRVGARAAELIEAPVMLVVVVLAARAIVRKHAELSRWVHWLWAGLFALGLMLFVEFTVVLWLRGLTLAQYFATRDPVSSTVYYLLLGAFAVLPLLMYRACPRLPVGPMRSGQVPKSPDDDA
jgi:hypothetical protein